jgi:DNA mismatch repair protein MutS2
MISQTVLDKLEFPKIVSLVTRSAITETGKNNLLGSKPISDKTKIVREGLLVSEAKNVLLDNNFPPIEYLPNLNEELINSKVEGAILSPKKILLIYQLLVTSRNLQSFLKNLADVTENLNQLSTRIFVDKNLENHITKIISEDGCIKDSASPKLSSIRKDIKNKNDELRKVVAKVTKDLISKELLREDYNTIREGRVVLPIKSEHKRQIRGFIHSESSSGQTVYIEPEETLHLNNELVSLSFAEKREIEKILKELTSKIGEFSIQIIQSLETVGYVDALFAKAKYSIDVNGTFPSLEENKPIKVLTAYHPLLFHKLGQEKTVPLSIEIDKTRILIITGPNAGGKTVVLKTVGLLVLMVQSGFHIPCSADSNFHIFENVLLDIGDQQSLEDDLSTFSSHLSNIKYILDSSNDASLVLLDEIGTGTDPAAGSALATSILLTFLRKNSIVLATTHHGSLKVIAHENIGFENASMEFDTEALIPTYRFRQGLPGSSYAFEIAKRLGLSDSLINLAKDNLSSNENKLESILIELEKQNHLLKEKLIKTEIENSRYEGLSNLYQEKVNQLEKDKKKILKEIKEKSQEILSSTQRKTELIIKDIKENQASKESIKEAKKNIKSLITETQNIYNEDVDLLNKTFNFRTENFVRVKGTETVGKIVEINDLKKTATIVSGSLKLQVNLNDLLPDKEPSKKSSYDSYSNVISDKQELRIDLRGKRSEEAEFEIIKFIDSAYSNGVQSIEILHGKGTGALKKTVRILLDQHEKVKDYHFAPVEYGGEGITIVELK